LEATGIDHSRAFATSIVQTAQELSYQDEKNPKVQAWNAALAAGKDPGPYPGVSLAPNATDYQAKHFWDRVKNQSRIGAIMRSFFAATSPLAPSIQMGRENMRKEVVDEITKAGDISTGVTNFLRKNPDANAYTVFTSKPTTGKYIPASQVAQDFINAHKGLMTGQFSKGAVWFVPQGGQYDSAVYNEQLGQGFREKKSPEEFVKDIHIAEGNAIYYDQIRPALKELEAQYAGDQQTLNQVHARVNAWMTAYGKTNPVWLTEFKSPDRQLNRQQAATQIAQLFAEKKAPNTPITDQLSQLNDRYQNYQAALLNHAQDGVTVHQLQKAWVDEMDALAISSPDLKTVITSVYLEL
jgi:hypothetical protein